MKHKLKAILPLLLIALLWFYVTEKAIWSTYLLPKPQKVAAVFLKALQSGELLRHTWMSLTRVFSGFGIAFLLAFCLGMIGGIFDQAAPYYEHLIEFMRNVPPLSLIPLLILWFGIGEQSKVIIIVLASFFPMFISIKKGFLSCDPKLLEVGDTLGLSTWQKFHRIVFPHAIPDILVGMRIGLGYSWRAIIGAEMVAAASGLGYFILDAQQMSRSDKILVGIFVIGLVGSLCNWLFSLLIKKIVPGGIDDSWR